MNIVSDSVDFLKGLLRRRDVRFIVIGGGATFVHFAIYWLVATGLNYDPQLGNIAGYLTAVSVSFLGNAYWSFGGGTSPTRALRFAAVSLLGFACNAFAVHLVTSTLRVSPNWAAIAIVGLTPFLTYQLSSKWAFKPTSATDASATTSRWNKPAWKSLLLYFLVDLFFFRHSYFSGADLVFGDHGDPRIVLVLLEHWNQWWHGEAVWNSPSFFWPQAGVLGYTDAYFLFAVPHIILRNLGLDPYLSMEGSFHAMKLVGFCGMAWLLSSGLRLTQNWALLGAVLFYCLSSLYWHSIHMQLATVSLVPWVIGLVLQWMSNGQRASTSSALGILFAAFFLTCFYMAWFSSLAVVLLVTLGYSAGIFKLQSGWWRRSGVGALIFGLGIIPFLYLYLPVLQEKQGHPFEAVIVNALYPLEIFRVGPDNALWGWLENFLFLSLYPGTESNYSYIASYERIAGFTPALVLVFLIVSFLAFKSYRTNQSADTTIPTIVLLAFVSVFFWLVSVRYGDISPWQLIYDWVPGGSAVRVPSRVLLFVSAFLVPVVAWGLWWLSRGGKKPLAVSSAVMALILVEQINTAPLQELSRAEEARRLAFEPPPAACAVFYVSQGDGFITGYSLLDEFYTPNIDAMLLASTWKVPTLNGISTWFPDGWALQHPGDAGYKKAVNNWVRQHDIEYDAVCALDMADKSWHYPAAVKPLPPKVGIGAQTLQIEQALLGGWSSMENWGVWSRSARVSIQFAPVGPNAGFALKLQAYRAAERPIRLKLEREGSVGAWQVEIRSSEANWYFFRNINSLTNDTVINISIENPRRPSEWGESDRRKLAIGLIDIKLISTEEFQ